MPNLQEYNWTLALITFKEDRRHPPVAGPIPLIVDDNRLLYTNYQTFVQALINQGEPSLMAFRGTFINLNNDQIETGFNIIVVARPAAKNSDYRHLESAYLHLCGLHNIKRESK